MSLAFAVGGALENMSEEIIALVPVLLLVTRRLGFDALTAVAISIGAAAVGAAFSPINPFQVQIAQKLAGLPLLSGSAFRMCVLGRGAGGWICGDLAPRDADAAPFRKKRRPGRNGRARRAARHRARCSCSPTFVVFVYGVMRLGWDFDQMSALFFAMGLLAGLIGGLGLGRHRAGVRHRLHVDGVRRDADWLCARHLRRARPGTHHRHDRQRAGHAAADLAGRALGARHDAVQAAVHGPVPSVSGQAVLTMPVLVPMSDLIGLSRQVVVLAYQYGAGLTELLTPTNGALMAVTAAAGVKYGDWLKFAVPLCAALLALLRCRDCHRDCDRSVVRAHSS